MYKFVLVGDIFIDLEETERPSQPDTAGHNDDCTPQDQRLVQEYSSKLPTIEDRWHKAKIQKTKI